MKAVVTTGNGGFDKLVFKDVPVPKLGAGEVLIRVLAAGVNNTEINTRLGWYSSSVTSSTDQTSDEQQADETQILREPEWKSGSSSAASPQVKSFLSADFL